VVCVVCVVYVVCVVCVVYVVCVVCVVYVMCVVCVCVCVCVCMCLFVRVCENFLNDGVLPLRVRGLRVRCSRSTGAI
jgi:hypothetical protein